MIDTPQPAEPTPAEPEPDLAEWRHIEYQIHRVADLAEHAREYRKRNRPAADPLGVAGLPDERDQLDALLADLCRRLIAALGGMVKGHRLALDLELEDTRALRLLCAYGHVHHRIRQIVGIAGVGYCWGDGPRAPADIYCVATGQARAMGRCHFYLSAIYSHRPAAVEVAQLCLDLVRQGPDQRRDELAAILAADGVGTEQLLDGMLGLVRGTPDGVGVLRRLGRRHSDVLMPMEAVRELQVHLTAAQHALAAAANFAPHSEMTDPPHPDIEPDSLHVTPAK